ncbi:hypothetical protein ACH47C_01650 [Streptomyces rishiriensis]|uniref:hypothetical protein n=1 Tax=Streptomyces rishiriensis TaxID=68264 RepID=UPI0033DC54F9
MTYGFGVPPYGPDGPPRRADEPGGLVDFPPVQNGTDYLLSVVENLVPTRIGRNVLDERVTPRRLKYAVLHLQAAVEVLLKYRLQLEHWTLVLQNLDLARANKSKKMTRVLFDQGNFVSCGPEETVERLRHVLGVHITDEEQEQLQALAKSRNALQHYGLTDADGTIEARTVAVLEFLIRFLDEELVPRLDGAERLEASRDMDTIRSGVGRIKAFVVRRLQRLESELTPLRTRTVECPDCRQWALVIGSPTRCLFCPSTPDPWQTAVDYATFVLRREWRSPPSTSDLFSMPARPPVDECPGCGAATLVRCAVTAAAPQNPTHLCFTCGRAFSDLCEICGTSFSSVDEQSTCEGCLAPGAPDG